MKIIDLYLRNANPIIYTEQRAFSIPQLLLIQTANYHKVSVVENHKIYISHYNVIYKIIQFKNKYQIITKININ